MSWTQYQELTEIPYKKKRPSSISKSKKCTKHKHDYQLVIRPCFCNGFRVVKECKLCHYIPNKFIFGEKKPNGSYLSLDEMKEKYPGIPSLY